MTEGAVHQGFVLRVSEFAYTELDHILAKTRQEENPLLLILDGLTDPHNLGSILRTADATNVSVSSFLNTVLSVLLLSLPKQPQVLLSTFQLPE